MTDNKDFLTIYGHRANLLNNNFKFMFLSRGQLESLSFDKFFSILFQLLPCYEFFLVSLVAFLLTNLFSDLVKF